MGKSHSKDQQQEKGDDLLWLTDNQNDRYEEHSDVQSTRQERAKSSCSLGELDRNSLPQYEAESQQGGAVHIINALDEKEKALAVLGNRKTYDDEEDYETFEDDAIDFEAYDRAREKYVYFWKSYDIYSQWHSSVFYVDGQKFINVEQYMMYRKAVLFGDNDIGHEILWCKNPSKIKALGTEVRGFDVDLWQQNCLHIAKEGNKAKFTHNDVLLGELLFTYPKVLVEASPLNKIWGIGLDEVSPEAWDERTWKGTNYLGYVLTELRDDIMVERGMIDEQDRERYLDKLLANAGYCVDIRQTNRHTEKGQGAEAETYHLFSGGFFSQWYETHFEVDEMTFNCAEQYMMFKKAELFKDEKNAKEILKTNNPKKMNKLGRQVKGFSEKEWQKHCLLVVKKGNIAKFSQDETLMKAIVATYPKVLVEANPDKIWGIGLNKEDDRSLNKHTWHGKNFLGYLLTEVRDELMCEWGLIKEKNRKQYMDDLQKKWDTPVHNPPDQYGKPENRNRAITQRKHSHSNKEDNRHQGGNKRHGEHDASNRSNGADHNKQNRYQNNHGDHHYGRGVDQNRYNSDHQTHGYDHKMHSDGHKTHDKHHNKPSRDHKAPSLETGDKTKRQRNRSKSSVSDESEVSPPANEDGWQHIESKKKADKNAKPDQNVPKSVKAGKGPVKHSERDNKHTVKSKQPGHESKSDGNTEKQKEIVGEFDLEKVMAEVSKKDHVETTQSSAPKNKGKRKRAQQQTESSEEIHKAASDNKESTSDQVMSRRQRRNLKKKQK